MEQGCQLCCRHSQVPNRQLQALGHAGQQGSSQHSTKHAVPDAHPQNSVLAPCTQQVVAVVAYRGGPHSRACQNCWSLLWQAFPNRSVHTLLADMHHRAPAPRQCDASLTLAGARLAGPTRCGGSPGSRRAGGNGCPGGHAPGAGRSAGPAGPVSCTLPVLPGRGRSRCLLPGGSPSSPDAPSAVSCSVMGCTEHLDGMCSGRLSSECGEVLQPQALVQMQAWVPCTACAKAGLSRGCVSRAGSGQQQACWQSRGLTAAHHWCLPGPGRPS